MTYRYSKIGFSISLTLHLSLVALVVDFSGLKSGSQEHEQTVPIKLHMFQVAQESVESDLSEPERASEHFSESKSKPAESSVVKPLPEPKSISTSEPVPEPDSVSKHEPEPEPASESEPPLAAQPAVAQTVPPLEEEVFASEQALHKNLEQTYKQALLEAIKRNKFFPRRARRLHQEGQVIVGFTLNNNGVIRNIRLVRSSGIGSLDKAAFRTIERLGRFEPFPAGIKRESWSFDVPLDYALQEAY